MSTQTKNNLDVLIYFVKKSTNEQGKTIENVYRCNVGSHQLNEFFTGKTKTYLNKNGVLYIKNGVFTAQTECLSDDEIKKLKLDVNNYKYNFIPAEFKCKQAKNIKIHGDYMLITYKNVQKMLFEGDYVEFGDIEEPKITIFNYISGEKNVKVDYSF